MKLYMKQKVFSWGDKFAVKDEYGTDKYFVEGEIFTLGKKLHVYNVHGEEVAYIEQELFTFLPCYHVFCAGQQVAEIRKEFSFLIPRYSIIGPDWETEGDFLAHDYVITHNGQPIVSIAKEWMTWGDTYQLDIANPQDEIIALAVVLTIDCVTEPKSGGSITISTR